MAPKIDVICDAKHKHKGECTSLAFDGEHLYSGGADGVINVWDSNLKFSREIPIHKDFPVLDLQVNDHKQLYSCGRDGSLRCFRRPWSHDHNDIMLQTVMDDMTAIHISNNTLYTGDDKGIVTKWYHNQVGCQYNVLEEVKSLAVEGTDLYTVRDTDVVVTDIRPQMMAQVTKATFPGRAPLLLAGKDGQQHKYIVCATRDGKGFTVVNNDSFFANKDAPYKILKTVENAHSLIINTFCMNGEYLFTAGFDGKVKKWKNIGKDPVVAEEIDTGGKCINYIIPGPGPQLRRASRPTPREEPFLSVFIGDADGFIKRIKFGP